MARSPAQVAIGLIALLLLLPAAWSATFTMTNNCGYTVWPGLLSGAGTAPLSTTGFALAQGASATVSAPASWSGRMWARTLCAEDAAGKFTCATGDCGSGALQCNGGGAAPPASLVEFTLDGSGGMDFFDVSLVDGYNLPMLVVPQGAGTAAGRRQLHGRAQVHGHGLPRRPERRVPGRAEGHVDGCHQQCGRRERHGVPQRVRGVRVPGVLLQRRVREPQHVPAVGVLAVLQERVPARLQLRVRRLHLHLHLRRRHQLRHHLLPEHHKWEVHRREPAGCRRAAHERHDGVPRRRAILDGRRRLHCRTCVTAPPRGGRRRRAAPVKAGRPYVQWRQHTYVLPASRGVCPYPAGRLWRDGGRDETVAKHKRGAGGQRPKADSAATDD